MSYIVPREKPKACRNCEFLYKTVYDCKLMLDKDYEDFDTQYANCPLIEIEFNEEQFNTIQNMLLKR